MSQVPRKTEALDKVTVVVAWVATVAWVVSFAVDIISDSYTPPAGVQAIMVIVAGALFARPFVAKATETPPPPPPVSPQPKEVE